MTTNPAIDDHNHPPHHPDVKVGDITADHRACPQKSVLPSLTTPRQPRGCSLPTYSRVTTTRGSSADPPTKSQAIAIRAPSATVRTGCQRSNDHDLTGSGTNVRRLGNFLTTDPSSEVAVDLLAAGPSSCSRTAPPMRDWTCRTWPRTVKRGTTPIGEVSRLADEVDDDGNAQHRWSAGCSAS